MKKENLLTGSDSVYPEYVIDSIVDAYENGNWQKFESVEEVCEHIKLIGDRVRKRKLDATSSE